jgi:hypothetical protein
MSAGRDPRGVCHDFRSTQALLCGVRSRGTCLELGCKARGVSEKETQELAHSVRR